MIDNRIEEEEIRLVSLCLFQYFPLAETHQRRCLILFVFAETSDTQTKTRTERNLIMTQSTHRSSSVCLIFFDLPFVPFFFSLCSRLVFIIRK